jgi:hypothetical protein
MESTSIVLFLAFIEDQRFFSSQELSVAIKISKSDKIPDNQQI